MRSSIVQGLCALVLMGCTSLEDLKKKCDEGEVEGCVKACEEGEFGDSGCLGAAEAHFGGQGVPKNDKKALVFVRKACEAKLGKACLVQAEHAANEEKLALNEKACEYGEEEACKLLIAMHVETLDKEYPGSYSAVPKILAALKRFCPKHDCKPWEPWLDLCADRMYMHGGLVSLDCNDFEEQDCVPKKKAATRDYCSGEKPIPKEYLGDE